MKKLGKAEMDTRSTVGNAKGFVKAGKMRKPSAKSRNMVAANSSKRKNSKY